MISYDFDFQEANLTFECILNEAHYPMLIHGNYFLSVIPCTEKHIFVNWKTGRKASIIFIDKNLVRTRCLSIPVPANVVS